MKNQCLENIKQIAFYSNGNLKIFEVGGKFININSNRIEIAKIEPFFSVEGTPCLYNLINSAGDIIASIQTDTIVITY